MSIHCHAYNSTILYFVIVIKTFNLLKMLNDESDRNNTYFAVKWRLSNLIKFNTNVTCKLTGITEYKRQRTAYQS